MSIPMVFATVEYFDGNIGVGSFTISSPGTLIGLIVYDVVKVDEAPMQLYPV